MEHKEFEIDGIKYLVLHPDPEIAWETGIELTKLIGEPIAAMANGGADALPHAVRGLLAKMDAKQSFALAKKILATAEAQNPSKIMLDGPGIKRHFTGKMGSMIKVVAEVISFTHADFFGAMRESIAEAMKKAME